MFARFGGKSVCVLIVAVVLLVGLPLVEAGRGGKKGGGGGGGPAPVVPQYFYFHPSGADPTRPTDAEPERRLMTPGLAAQGGAVFSLSPDYVVWRGDPLIVQVWADVAGANALKADLNEPVFCAASVLVICPPYMAITTVELRHVEGTGTVLADGTILGGKFASAPIGFTSSYAFYPINVRVWHGSAAGTILYDSAAMPSCLAINAPSC